MPDSTIPLLCVLGLLALSSACYIQNCPRGGSALFLICKDSACHVAPGNRGLCFGPSICCGEGMGCYVGSPEAASCVEENYLPSPCEAGGRVCGSEEGHCAAPGVCCDAESCLLDPDCLDYTKHQPPSEQNSSLMEWMLHATRRERPQ